MQEDLSRKQPSDHCHTLQLSKLTATSDSTRKKYERQLLKVPEDTTPKRGPIRHHSGPDSPLGRPPGLVGGPLTLCRLVLLTIYIDDSKMVSGWLIQRWSRELTRIDDLTIPCSLLNLDSLPATPPRPIYTNPYTLP
jgi:hypothetical protein